MCWGTRPGSDVSSTNPRKEWEARIRELEPTLPAKHVKAISIELTKVDQARANLYTVLIDAGLDHETFEASIRAL